jgi:hypothetical protein
MDTGDYPSVRFHPRCAMMASELRRLRSIKKSGLGSEWLVFHLI